MSYFLKNRPIFCRLIRPVRSNTPLTTVLVETSKYTFICQEHGHKIKPAEYIMKKRRRMFIFQFNKFCVPFSFVLLQVDKDRNYSSTAVTSASWVLRAWFLRMVCFTT